jgi:hypothetical protein
LYFQARLKLNFLGKLAGIDSFDLGYKYMLPLSDNIYTSDAAVKVLTSRQFIFIGVSF